MKVFMSIVTEYGTPVILAITAWLSSRIAAFISTRIKAETLKNVLFRINDTTFAVVQEVFQTFVDAKKADGKLSKEDAATAKTMAMNAVKEHLGETGITEIGKTFGLSVDGVDRYLGTKIESAVNATKRVYPPNPP